MIRPVSVIDGPDRDILPKLLEIHAVGTKILDCTYNTGKMWKKTGIQPIRFDINKDLAIDVCGDFTKLPFRDETFDVLVYDPPHLPVSAASANSSQIYHNRYGITADDPLRSGDNVSSLFKPFLIEAKRVLKNQGIILAKLIDLVHNHKYQWQHVDYINTVNEIGLTPCDVVIKSDPISANLQSSKWINVRHFRRKHTYWIVTRKGRCEAKK